VTRRSIDQLLGDARLRLARLTPRTAHEAMLAGATLVDVRTHEQLDQDGRISGALTIALNVLEWRLDPDSSSRHPEAPSLDDPVIILCNQGYCSSLAAARLQDLGFTRATDVIGGFESWRADGLPVAPATEGTGASDG